MQFVRFTLFGKFHNRLTMKVKFTGTEGRKAGEYCMEEVEAVQFGRNVTDRWRKFYRRSVYERTKKNGCERVAY